MTTLEHVFPRAKEDLWQPTLAAARLLFWEWELRTNRVEFSADFGAFFGRPACGRVLASADELLSAVDPADRDRMAEVFRQAIETGEACQLEFRGPPRDGRPTWYVAHARAERDAGGSPVRLVGLTQEVTGARLAEVALRRALAERQAHDRADAAPQRVAELAVLYRVGEICGQVRSEDELFARVTAVLAQEFSEKNCGFVLLDPAQRQLRAHASFFLANPQADRAAIPLERGVIGRVVRTGRPARVADVRQDADYWAADGTTLSELCVPLLVGGAVVGVVNVERSTPDSFTAQDEQFLGTVARLVGEAVERLRTMRALRESEERYRRLFETCPDSVFVVDASGRLLSANPAAARMHGFTLDELHTMRVQDLDDEDSARLAPERVRRLLAGESLKFEVGHRRQDGSTFPVEVVAARMQVGEQFNIIAFDRDITERKEAERALRAGHRYFNALFEQSVVAVGQLDSRSGRLVRVNRAYCDLLGYTAEELLQLDFQSLTHPDDLPEDLDNMARLRAGQQSSFRLEKRLLRRDGATIWVRLTVVPLWSEDAAPDYHLAFVEDVTERRRLEQSLRLTQFSIDRAMDSVFWIAPSAEILYANDAACRTLGYAREELVGRTVPDIDPNFPAEAWPAHWEDLKRRGSFTFETAHFTKDGGLIQTEVTVNYIEFEGRAYNCAMVRDITNRKRAEQNLRENRELLQNIIDSSTSFIYLTDLEGRFLLVNRQLETFFQVSRDALIGRTRQAVLPEQIARQHRDNDLEVLRLKQALHFEESIERDEPRTYFTVKYPVRRADGAVYAVGGISTDVTELKLAELERRRAEAELRQSEERFSKLFSASPFAINVVSFPDGKIVDVNAAFLQLFEFERQEVLGRTTLELGVWDRPADRLAIVERLHRTGSARHCEIVLRTKTGARRTLLVSAELIELQGQPHALAMSLDVTDRKRAEEQARELRDALAHATRVGTLSELASGLAHELNQPLAALALQANAALALREPRDAAQLADCLRRIEDSACRAGEIVRRMRSFIDARPSQRTPVDLHLLIHEVLALLAGNVQGHRATLDLQLCDDPPPVLGDGIQIQQVLLNLLRNAIEAMSGPQIERRILTIRTQVRERDLQVDVEDTGSGLDPQIAAALFQPFQTTKTQGLGLGLAICQTLIVAQGGTIWGGPRPDGGTTFSFTLPLADAGGSP